MSHMEHLDEELQTARTTLIQRLGRSNYERYVTIVEAAVGGRLSRRELDAFVSDIIKQSDTKSIEFVLNLYPHCCRAT